MSMGWGRVVIAVIAKGTYIGTAVVLGQTKASSRTDV